MRPTRRQLLFGVAVTLVTAPLLYAALRPSQPRNFGVTRQGTLYRSGQLTPTAFQQVLTDNNIRTVVTLRPVRDADSNPDVWEETVCRERGVKHVRVSPREGSGEAALDRMAEGFLAVMDDPANYPVLVHCFAGRDRTGAMCAIYRMEFEGWTPQQAAAEMQVYDFDPDKNAAAKAYEKYVLSYRTRRATAANK